MVNIKSPSGRVRCKRGLFALTVVLNPILFHKKFMGHALFVVLKFHWIRPERRSLERIKEFSIFPLEISGKDMEAMLIDTSKTGAGISVNNPLSIRAMMTR